MPHSRYRSRKLLIVIARSILVVLLFALSVLLFFDGSTFGLRVLDPSRGRESGCFTLLDDVFSTRKPNDALRWVELLSPLLTLPLGYVVISWNPGRSCIV